MNNLQIFNNPEFGQIRTIDEDGKVLFCGSDVAKALGYKNPSKALSDHCKGVTKRYTPTSSGRQEMNFIPEGDIYRLAAKSELPGAEKFESWIFDEVLPSIRKHGAYITENTIEQMIESPEFGIRLLRELDRERKKRRVLEERAEQDRPKVLFADAVEASHTSILVGELAKILKQNGKDIGQKRLFAWLRNNGYLIKRNGTDYNMPTQKSMELGLMEIKERTVSDPAGVTRITKTPKITGKGQTYFVSKFLKEQEA